MLLSIGLIVKNETNRLRSCLKYLAPLTKKVESEIVIVDTGSTDDTISIAREFTDIVLEKPWNDNFAEAKNHAIDAAKGEWYMAIDADEYFEDISDMVHFFLTDRHKDFNMATYEIRSYEKNGRYTASRHLRLMRTALGLRFVGIVHELLPTVQPVAHIGGYVNHLGYSGEEALKQKAKRNHPLVKKAYMMNPRDVNAVRYLAEYALNEKRVSEGLDYAKKGLVIAREVNNEDMFFAFYELIIRLQQADDTNPERFRDSINTLAEFFDNMNNDCYGAIRMWNYKGICHFHLSEYTKGIAAFKKCYSLVESLLSNDLDMECALVVWGGDITGEAGLWTCAFQIATCYVKLNDLDSALVWFERIPEYKLIYSPFFVPYSQAVNDNVRKKRTSLDNLGDLRRLCVYLVRAREANELGLAEEMIDNIKLALALDDRFALVIKEQMERILG